jgi:hypothetical protein
MRIQQLQLTKMFTRYTAIILCKNDDLLTIKVMLNANGTCIMYGIHIRVEAWLVLTEESLIALMDEEAINRADI